MARNLTGPPPQGKPIFDRGAAIGRIAEGSGKGPSLFPYPTVGQRAFALCTQTVVTAWRSALNALESCSAGAFRSCNSCKIESLRAMAHEAPTVPVLAPDHQEPSLKPQLELVNVSTTRNLPLIQAASGLVEEIYEGKWRHVTELETKPAQDCDEIVAELRSRCSGFTRDEYQTAIANGLLAPRPQANRSSLSTWFYWAMAFTFIWAFFVANLGFRKFFGWNEWVAVYGYPAMCGAATFYLLKVKRSGNIAFALVNAGCGMAWIVSVIWALRAFAANFWK